MKKTISRLVSWLRSMHERAVEARLTRQGLRLTRESRRAVQVMEFEGDVYISVNGVPVVPTDALAWDTPTTLNVAREAYMQYKEENERIKN